MSESLVPKFRIGGLKLPDYPASNVRHLQDLTAGDIVVKIQDILQQSKDTIFYVNDQLNQNEETDAEEDF